MLELFAISTSVINICNADNLFQHLTQIWAIFDITAPIISPPSINRVGDQMLMLGTNLEMCVCVQLCDCICAGVCVQVCVFRCVCKGGLFRAGRGGGSVAWRCPLPY